MQCLFCDIINNKKPSFKVWENEDFLAFLDIKPINPGHMLLIPKRHIQGVFDLPDDIYNEIFIVARKLSEPLRQTTSALRIGFAIEGFGVPHAHVHLVPINSGNELNPERSKRTSETELRKMQEKLLNGFEKIK